ncbi:hypothetical protein HZU72_23580 [Halomonas sp. QX-2]|uniref:Uncharacterized protein n=2 Tax=Vreelandella sedimenti TaxID=2729618 RepID=A0A7Z0NC30_9GAMM|nr:hypothetical protein [Halomonas sp. UBA3173]NYT75358.1 hypothetical protein [Halomonas sedimenti]|tara:strand:- start:52 stop:471 length:420 start_codon:yes stop_codon:yes gene_type:complete
MIEIFFVGLTTAATLFAALSAWMSYRVSNSALNFQKNYAKNQQLIAQLNSTISKLRTVKYLISNTMSISDDQVGTIEPLFIEVRLDLLRLEEIGAFDYSSHRISKVTSLGEMIDEISSENTYLAEVINALEARIACIFK